MGLRPNLGKVGVRKLRRRIEVMGGDRSSWEDGVWNMQKEQWKLVWDGERAFWNVVPKLIAAGYARVEDMAQGTCEGSTKVQA